MKGKNTVMLRDGTVKFYNEAKGFGSIKDNRNGQEYFVARPGLIDCIRAGDVVSYTLKEGKKGLVAVDVRQR